MKRYVLITLAFISLLFAGCKEKEDIGRLEIVSANDLFTFVGGEGTIVFESSSEVTSAVSSDTWIEARARKSDVLLTVAENTEITSRMASVTLTNKEGITAKVEISQKGAKYQFDGSDINFKSVASSAKVEYAADDKMVISVPEAAKEWLDVVVSPGSFTIYAKQNRAISARSAVLNYAIANKSASFKVNQEAAEIYLKDFKPEDINAPADGLVKEFSFSTNSTLTANASADWITASVADGVLTVKVSQNFREEPREGKIDWSVAKSDMKGSIKVSQEKGKVERLLSVKDSEDNDVKEIECSFHAGKLELQVLSNAIWKATTDADWISVTPAECNEKLIEPQNVQIEVNITECTENKGREAVIKFTGEDVEDGPWAIKLTQKGFTNITITPTTVGYDNIEVTFTPEGEVAYLYGIAKDSDNLTADVIANAIAEDLAGLFKEYSSQYTPQEIMEMVCETEACEDVFTELDEKTDYVIYALGMDYQLNLTTPVFMKKVKTTESPWKFLGTGKYTDGFVSGLFDIDPNTASVEVYESKEYPGCYAVKNPYGPEMLAGWWYPNATASQLANYEGEFWKSVMYEIHAEDPDNVFIIHQETGFYTSAYGFHAGGNAVVREDGVYLFNNCSVGTLKNGKITFPKNALRTQFPHSTNSQVLPTSLFYANINESFCLELPAGNTAASSPKSLTNRKDVELSKTLRRRVVKSNIQPVTAGWSVRLDLKAE